MPRRIGVTNLNASTIDILNTIRANASLEYQSLVPEITSEIDIPKIGEQIYGYNSTANEFLSALMNKVAMTVIRSMTFNDPFVIFNKGQLTTGELVEEIFVSMAKAREFNPEKAEAREFKRTLPDVRAVLHPVNAKLQYPVTIQMQELKHAFQSANGVTNLINKIIQSVYEGFKYDNYLIHKYLLIKAISSGKMYPVSINQSDIDNSAIAFRGMSSMLAFPSKKYNAYGVTTTTQPGEQYLLLDAMYYAKYGVKVLASAFNMSEVDFKQKVILIDSWSEFDNERFDVIRANSDFIEEVTDSELAITEDVLGVLIDKEWFQVYDDVALMTDTKVASGLYWNYFYNIFKVYSTSPFSNALVFVDNSASTSAPATLTATITDKSVGDGGTVFTIAITEPSGLVGGNYQFIQTEDMTEDGVAVHPYGAIIFPALSEDVELISVACAGNTYTYIATESVTGLSASTTVGTTFTLTKDV